MGFMDKLLNPDKVSKYDDEHYIKLKHEAILHSVIMAAGMSPDCDEGITYHQLEKVPCVIHQLKRDAEKPAPERISRRHKAILQGILSAAGQCPEHEDERLFSQLKNIPEHILRLKYSYSQECIPAHIKRQIEQLEITGNEHIRVINQLQDIGNRQKEEIEQLKERIKFLEETKEKIYLVKKFK